MSGPVGTVITVNGNGFTGVNQAWVGNGHDAAVQVVSDTQVRITVPASATNGQIALLNPQKAAWSPDSFTLTSGSATPTPTPEPTPTPTPTPEPTLPQPIVTGFTPASGPAGTVLAVSGSGFTGATQAWVGNGHNATLTVLSDTSARVIVPNDATSGVVTILNATYSGSSGALFTLTAPVTPAPPASGTMAVRVQGSRLIDATGAVIQLRGVNFSGFEFTAIQGWSPSDPSGGQAGQPGGPKWSALKSWKVNALRIPLNAASWLGNTCTDTSGVVRNADPGANYKQAVQEQVRQAIENGIYVILDLHWTAPYNSCPMLQTQMADADHALDFWYSVANTFKSNPAVIFELYNEPFMNFDFTGNTWEYMMRGTGGSFSGYPATSGAGNWQDIKKPWDIASMQDMLDVVRGTGATNVVLVGGMQYAQDLSGWLQYRPTDPLNQMGAAWHPYRKYATAWDYPYPNFYPEVMTDAQNILAAGFPIVMTEVGGANEAGRPSSPIVTTMTNFADDHGISVLGWAWDVWQEPENQLIKDVNGTPTDGYGVTYRNWLLAH